MIIINFWAVKFCFGFPRPCIDLYATILNGKVNMIPIGHHVPTIPGQIHPWLQGGEFLLPK